VIPLVTEARDWEHGVFLGSTMASEKTAAAAGGLGQLRFDPFAMLPFCGYNMADYFGNWLKVGRREGAQLPRIFFVNWFRKDDEGKFIWPGFGENSRVLAWIFRRCEDAVGADESPLGLVPRKEDLPTEGLDLGDDELAELLHVDVDHLREQIPQIKEHLAQFGDDLPDPVRSQLEALEQRLG
jgi:phosphoenolpyruvate carboxykinase (GTP)